MFIDEKNSLNSAAWSVIVHALEKRKMSNYMVRLGRKE